MGNTKKRRRVSAESLPKGVVSFLLASPAVFFIISMAVELFKSLFLYNSYNIDIFRINRAAAIAGLIAVAVYFFMRHYRDGGGGSVFKNPAVICFGALILLMLLSTWHNGITEEALFGTFYRSEPLSFFILYPAVYYFVTSLIDSETAKRRIINGFLAVSLLIAVMTLLHIFAAGHGLDDLASFTSVLGSEGVLGIYHNTNHYGYSLVIAISLSGAMYISAEKVLLRVFYLADFAFFTAVLILNNTFGAYLAVLAALVFLVIVCVVRDRKPNPRTFVLIGVFIAVSCLVNLRMVWLNISTLYEDVKDVIISAPEADWAGSSRWRLWKATFRMISERPLLGYGVEGIGERLLAEAGNDRPHNEFLQYAAFFGIPALVCYIGAVGSVFLSFLRHRSKASPCAVAALTAAFGYLASSFFGNTMFYTTPLFFIVLGMADIHPKKAGS